MKSIIRFSMKNTIAICMLIFIIVGGGIFTIQRMNIEKYPNVDIPYVSMFIMYPGASPQQAMDEIGEPVEKELMNIEGIENIYGEAMANGYVATLQFDMSADLEAGEEEARAAIAKLNLPDTAEEPTFHYQGPDGDPAVFAMGIYSDQVEQSEIQSYVQDKIIPQLEMIDGIDKIDVAGVDDQEVFVRLNPDDLKENGLTLEDVKQAIQANNMSIPTGDLRVADKVFPVRVNHEMTSVDEIKKIKIVKPGVSPQTQVPIINSVELADIAEIAYGAGLNYNFTRVNGEAAVKFSVTPKGGENVVKIVDEVKESIDKVKLPNSYEVKILRDQSIEVKDSVYAMLREAFLGALMAVVVTLLFLRNFRSTLIAIISIPLSILASLTVLHFLGYTLNIMTLAGIAVAVGRVVDDSIVVIENVFRRIRASKERNQELVEQSTREVATAITSSTITTIAVFLPMAFVSGIVGKFFAPLAWTIVISLFFSLIVAVTVVPLLSKLFLLKINPKEHQEGLLQRGYRATLGWALHHRLLTLLIAVVLLGSSIGFIAPKLGMTFLPEDKVQNYDISITMPKGTSPAETNKIAREVEDILLAKKEIALVDSTVRGQDERVGISFVVKDSVSDVDQLVSDLRNSFKQVDAEEITLTGVGSLAGGGQSDYVLVVNGPSIADITKASKMVMDELNQMDGVADVISTLDGDEPELSIVLDDEKVAEHGLMPAMVSKSLREMVSGDTVTSVPLDGKDTNIKLSMKLDPLHTIDQLGEQEIYNMLGEPVKLKEIGKIKEVKSRTVISHLNKNEYVMVVAKITSSKTSEVTKKADDAIAKLDLPEGVSYYKEGAAAAMEDGFTNMGIAILISILLVYMVLVITFGEGKAPFVILFAIPFSVIGALIGLFIMNEPIGMPAMIGVLMLNGIVVTNAIVLIDKVKQNEKIGYSKHDALMEAGVIRVRPILMTAIATIGALLPMAISSHAGIISTSLAVVVIGGLTTSTLLTLIIVPVLYSVMHPTKKAKKLEEIIKSKAM